MVKEFLSQRGISFREKDVSRDQSAAQEMVSLTGQMGVPVTVIDSTAIVGFDRTRLEAALAQRRVAAHPSFGAAVADASRITARQGGGAVLGAYIGRVKPGSPADMLGLAQGDIITTVNRQSIANAADLERALAALAAGSHLQVIFLRGDKRLSAEGIL